MSKDICSVEDCQRPAKARGWCHPHWKRWRRNGAPLASAARKRRPVEDRFWEKVAVGEPAECWPWKASADEYGYGFFRIDPQANMRKSHRVAWALTHGDAGILNVLHRCDNPPCCNPQHLFLGTNADNVADRVAKGRSSRKVTHQGEQSPLGKLTETQVIAIRCRYAEGDVTQSALGLEYGVSQTEIGRIVRRVRWKHVAA